MDIGKRVIIGKARFGMRLKDIHIGDGVVIGDGVQFRSLRSLQIGDYTKIHSNVRVSGEDDNASVTIGYNAWIGEETLIDCKKDVTIADNVGIGCRSQIWTHGYFPAIADGNPSSFGSVVIEKDAWLPPACIVLPGVRIGNGSIIGTGSVITKDVPSHTFATGIPCRVVQEDESRFRKKLTPREKTDMVLDRCLEYLRRRGARVTQISERSWICRLMFRRFQLDYEDQPDARPAGGARRCLFTWELPDDPERFPSGTSLFVLSTNQYTRRRSFHEWVVIRALLDRCTLRFTPLEPRT